MRADSETADYPSSQMASRRFRDLREAPKEPPRGPAWARPFIFFEVVWPSRAQTRTAVVAALLPIAAVLVISLAVVLVIAVR
jgi:hypothetical protein